MRRHQLQLHDHGACDEMSAWDKVLPHAHFSNTSQRTNDAKSKTGRILMRWAREHNLVVLTGLRAPTQSSRDDTPPLVPGEPMHGHVIVRSATRPTSAGARAPPGPASVTAAAASHLPPPPPSSPVPTLSSNTTPKSSSSSCRLSRLNRGARWVPPAPPLCCRHGLQPPPRGRHDGLQSRRCRRRRRLHRRCPARPAMRSGCIGGAAVTGRTARAPPPSPPLPLLSGAA